MLLIVTLFLFTISLLFIEYGGYKLASISIIFFIALTVRKRNTLIEYSVVVSYIIISFILYVTVVLKGGDVVWGGYEYYPKFRSYIVYLFAASFFFLLARGEYFLTSLLLVIKILLILMILVFLLEYIHYIFYGEGLNITKMFLSVEQRSLSREFFRPSIHFAEPGTFVNYSFPLLFVYGYFKGFDNKISIAFSLTLILTLSIQGIIIGGSYLLYSIISQRNLSKILILFLILLLCSFVFYEYVDSYVDKRFYSGVSQDASLIKRLYPLQFLSDVDTKRLLLGSGLFVDDCHCLVRDVGLAINILYHFGVFGIFFILLPFLTCFTFFSNKIGYLILFISFVFTSKIAIFSGYYHLVFLMSFFFLIKKKSIGYLNEVSCVTR